MDLAAESSSSKLDTLAHEAASEPGEGGFMNPVKKRGRKPGSKNKEKTDAASPANPSPAGHNPDPILQSQQRIEANKQFISGSLDFLDDALFPLHETPDATLKNKPKQKEQIVINGAICMEQYLPDLMNRHMPLILVTMGLGAYGFGIYNARLIKMKEMNERAMRQENKKSTTPNGVLDLAAAH